MVKLVNKLTIIGLGPSEYKYLSIEAKNHLEKSQNIFLRTKHHPIVKELDTQGYTYKTFDEIYERHNNFSGLYEDITQNIISALEKSDVTYCVPGHPFVAEKTTKLLTESVDNVDVISSQSFIDIILTRCQIDPIEGFLILDGLNFKTKHINFEFHILISQLYDQMSLSEAKLILLEKYSPETKVYKLSNIGSNFEKIEECELFEIDHEMITVDNLLTLYIPKQK